MDPYCLYSLVSLRSILLHISETYSCPLQCCGLLCEYTIVYLHVDRYLCCFHLLTIVNKGYGDISVHILGRLKLSFLFGVRIGERNRVYT